MENKARSEAAIIALAARFKLLAEPVRLRILEMLAEGERSVQEVTALTGLRQPHISRQLAILAESGILLRRKEGTRVYYSLRDSNISAIMETASRSLREHLLERLENLED
jgi:DNA-binding transcriptional ArsR family regulator